LTSEKDRIHVMKIFELLDGAGIGVKEIWAVYNPMLVSAFALTKEKFTKRAETSGDVFGKERWKDNKEESEKNMAKRYWTKGFLDKKIYLFPWNSFSVVPILATVHGTSASSAWKICQAGFATLSSLDSGFYGAGIYFTTSSKYAIPYYGTKPDPSIIISWVITGNAYPVIEHPRKAGSLAGTIIKPGYQSHYVCTNNKGMPHPDMSENYQYVFDEIVINQEAQVAPAYVLMLDPLTFPKLIADFNRSVPAGSKKKRDDDSSSGSGEAVELEENTVEMKPLFTTPATGAASGRSLTARSVEYV